MLQRIQTIFLFLIAVSMGILLGFPIWEKAGMSSTETVRLTALQLVYTKGISSQITPVYYLAIMAVAVAIVALFTIFKYRNRLLQMGLCAINAILLTALMGFVLYLTLYKGKDYFNPDDQGNFGIGFYAIVAALIFNMLANRFIRRDEKLVQESNRLR
jgi:glucan phosphoethanolaminetransferase (alkaline phosphatase superfamily)